MFKLSSLKGKNLVQGYAIYVLKMKFYKCIIMWTNKTGVYYLLKEVKSY